MTNKSSKKYLCGQCGKEIDMDGVYHVFEHTSLSILRLVHDGECLKRFRRDVYDMLEKGENR